MVKLFTFAGLMTVLFSVSAQADEGVRCGRISQLAHAISCMRAHAKATIQEANRPHLVFVNASEAAFKGMTAIVKESRSSLFAEGVTRADALIDLQTVEWLGLVLEMQDEVQVHYYVLQSGAAPKRILSFDSPGISSFYPKTSKEDPEAFSFYLKGLEDWIYEMFKGE